MNRIFLVAFLFFSIPFYGQRKSSSEICFFMGGSYYIGDLNPHKHFNSLTQPAFGIGYRHNFNSRFATRGNLFYGNIKGDDAQSNSFAQQQRNLNFKSRLLELSGQMEFNFLEYKIGDPKSYLFTPYAFLGLGLFKFKPFAELGGAEYALQPLGTEGQGTTGRFYSKKYKLIQFSVPFGVGIKLSLAKQVGVSIEWGMRKTFTDYLDDVSKNYVDPVILAAEKGTLSATLSDRSLNKEYVNNTGRQRGNSKNKDWYSFTGIVFSFILKNKEPKCHSYH